MEPLVIESSQEMRWKHFPSVSVGEYNEQNDYLAYLRSKGVELNSKLFPSIFNLKNGLPYIGMAVRQAVSGGEVLIRVPEQLILSSGKAIHQTSLLEVFQDNFFCNENVTWEDRAIIVYCLFLLHQKDESNPWYQMVRRFPKECDIACFWSEQQLSKFRDKSVKNAVLLDIKSFQEQWIQFLQLQKRHQILQAEQFNKQNYRIIFITGINRSFGGDMSFVSLVPFAELFNHHCSKAYFGLEREKENYFLREEQDQVSSSGSCESEEYIEDGEFQYDSIQSLTYNWQVNQSYDLVKKQKQRICSETEKLLNMIDKQLNWENFTILVVGQFMLKLRVNLKEFLVGRKQYIKSLKQVEAIGHSFQLFKTLIQKYFQRANKKSYWKKPEKPSIETTVKSTLSKPLLKQYQNLIIKTQGHDVYQKNNQIYFRYGSNSNRTLLLHYGFAIEGNKYQHIWITLSIKKYLSEFPDVLDKVMEKKLSLLRKFKLYNHRLNIDLIIFFRLNNWTFYGERAVEEIFTVTNIPKEIAILQQIRSILEENKKVYEGHYDLTDQSLNYHQYFTAVYHLEKLKIFKKQILLHTKMIEILDQIKRGQKIGTVLLNLTKSQKTILLPYIESIKE